MKLVAYRSHISRMPTSIGPDGHYPTEADINAWLTASPVHPVNPDRITDTVVTIALAHYESTGWWLKIVDGGVTGYESISIRDLLRHTGGWCANAGTPGSWDQLYIPECEMDTLRGWVRFFEPLLTMVTPKPAAS